MPWTKGIVFGEVTQDGRIVAQTRDLQVMTTPKPPDPDAARKAGLDVDTLERVHKERKPGKFEGVAHFGGATAMLVRWVALAHLDERRMSRLLEKYFGYMPEPAFPEWVAIMHVRNTGAPGRQNDAEPSGGMAETVNLLVDQIGEMVEMGVYKEDGRARFVLPRELTDHQEKFDVVQTQAWDPFIARPEGDVSPSTSFFSRDVGLELLTVGRDTLNGQAGVVTAGPVGDFAITSVAKLQLEGTGWKFRDLETHNGTPMRRRMVAIAPRPDRSPVVFALNFEGGLNDFGHHFVLDGENRALAVTHIGRAVLEALGWLK
ncbi:hypothetical protein HYW17_03715 [Candidatus Uhrbacteria bacterium]|nr:hypothetical protein [Candidatus Uhrbacteria bacterium]